MTFGDKIRSMTDEELADFLWSIGQNPVTGNTYLNGNFIFFSGNGNGWLDWLKKEETKMSEKKPHWLYDGDCVICQRCRKAYDISTNADRSIPTVCPFCGSEMNMEEVLRV